MARLLKYFMIVFKADRAAFLIASLLSAMELRMF